jgi:hypothetical protein
MLINKAIQAIKLLCKLIPIAMVLIGLIKITGFYVNHDIGFNKLQQTKDSMNYIHQRKGYGQMVLAGQRPKLHKLGENKYKVEFRGAHFLGINGIEKRRYAINNFYFLMKHTAPLKFELEAVSRYWLKDVTPDYDVKTTRVIPKPPVYLVQGFADKMNINHNYSYASAKRRAKLKRIYLGDIKKFDKKTVQHLVKTFGDKEFMTKWKSIYEPDDLNKLSPKQFTKAFKQKVGDKYLMDFVANLNGDTPTYAPHVSKPFLDKNSWLFNTFYSHLDIDKGLYMKFNLRNVFSLPVVLVSFLMAIFSIRLYWKRVF